MTTRKKKNTAAVSLGKRGQQAFMRATTPERRKEIATKAGLAAARARKLKAKHQEV